MSDVLTAASEPSKGGKFWRWVKWTLRVFFALFLALFLASFLFAAGLLELPFRLLLGWAPYLAHVVPQTQVNVELLLCSLGALVLGMIGLQWLMSRLRAPLCWPWRWTLACSAMLVVMFSTSIAAVGIVHQVGWLFRLPKWIEWSGLGVQTQALNHAKQVLLAARQHAKEHEGRLPDTCAEMIPEIVSEARIFWATMDRGMPLEPLVYAGAGLSDTDDGNLLVIWTPRPSADGRRVVMRLDGSGSFVREEEFQSMLVSRQAFFNRHEAAVKTPR